MKVKLGIMIAIALVCSLSCSSAAKPVYVISDNINNVEMDNNRIDTIITELNKTGITAYNCGVGTDNIAIFDSIPQDSVLIEIIGGADAGMIWEMGTPWYLDQRGNRTVFMLFVPPATDITNLEYLERAWDDNFSPSDFCGLAHPDQYLKDNGYGYYYWTENNTDGLIKNIKSEV